MIAPLPIDQLEVVAVLGDSIPASEAQSLAPVFRDRSSGEIAWPERIEGARVFATSVGTDMLEAAVADGAVVMIAPPLQARGSDWELVPTGNGGVRYIRADELWARQRALLREHLTAAIHEWATGDRELSTDLFDKAYLVSRRNSVAAVLRAGASKLSGDADWQAMCFADLERTIEYQGVAMLSCRANSLWRELPHQTLLEDLFDQARRGYDEQQQPEAVLEDPVGPNAKKLAVAFELYRRLRPDLSARLPSTVVIGVVAGNPDAVATMASRLADDEAWLRCVSRTDQLFASAQSSGVEDALARAQLDDLTRFARTLYTLEITADERDRRTSWSSFCRNVAGVDTGLTHAPWRAGELLADDTRHRLGLNGGPISGLRRFAEEQAGVFVGRLDALDRYDCASSVPRNTPPCVFLEPRREQATDGALRERFAIAHELAHLLIDRHAANAWVCSTTGHDRSDVEKRANAFAAYFMAPRHAVRALVPVLPDVRSAEFIEDAQRVRKRFGLSAIAAGEHLRNCHYDRVRDPLPAGRLPEEVRERLAKHLSNQPTDVDEPGAGDPAVEPGSLREGRFRALVEKLRRASILDTERASRLLGVS